MNIIIIGPQGSGKGTQADLLVKKYGLKHLEIGKVLRSAASSDNKYAAKIKESLNSGQLVPDEYVKLLAWDFINKNGTGQGFLFDGYPRSILQYEDLKDMLARKGLKIDRVINIEISLEESVKRLSARRALENRDDDQPETIKRRLEIYRQQTHPVFEEALEEGIGVEINGEQSIEKVHQDIVSKL